MNSDHLKVDVDAVLRERVPRYRRFMPRFVVRALERYICQDRMNEVLEVTRGKSGSAFCRGVLGYLGVDYSVEGESRLPAPSDTAVTYVSNHPLGALDGICLIDWVARRHGVEPYFVVNDLLSVLRPLDGVFVPVNKHGRQNRGAVGDVDSAFADLSRPVIMFPAGLCSRRDGGVVADRRWNKMFVCKSAESGRTVLPIRFEGRNTDAFYRLASRRERLGLKFNLEMIRLPREIFFTRGNRYIIKVGTPVPATSLERGPGAMRQAADIRASVYAIP